MGGRGSVWRWGGRRTVRQWMEKSEPCLPQAVTRGDTGEVSVQACWWCSSYLMMAVRGGSSCLQVVVLPVQCQPVVRVVLLLVVAAVGAQQVAEQRDEAGEQRAVRHHAKLAPAPPPCIQHIHIHTRRCQDMVDGAADTTRRQGLEEEGRQAAHCPAPLCSRRSYLDVCHGDDAVEAQ